MDELLAGGTGVPFTAAATTTAGFVVLAVIDIRTGQIYGRSLVAIGAVSLGALGHDRISPLQLLGALIAAAATFIFYLADWGADGFGGGDVKAAPLLALPFGASSIALGLGVVLVALGVHLLLTYMIRPAHGTTAEALPHAPAMAIAAAVGTGVLLAGTG